VEQQDLTGKVVLITGGVKRVGAVVARYLHEQGMNLVLHYRHSEKAAHALQAELQEKRPNSVILLQADLLHTAKLNSMVHEVIEQYERLDVLINNASSFYPTPVGDATEKEWDDLIGSNLKAPFFLSQAAAPHLAKHSGCIINMADIHAERPLSEHPIYCSAKAGLVMLTKSLAKDLGPQVRVNAIAPGAILWPEQGLNDIAKQRLISKIPLKRHGNPMDIAKTMLFLIRDGQYINGQVIAVDGGRSVVQ